MRRLIANIRISDRTNKPIWQVWSQGDKWLPAAFGNTLESAIREFCKRNEIDFELTMIHKLELFDHTNRIVNVPSNLFFETTN